MTAPADPSPSPSCVSSSTAALDAFLAFAPLVAGEDEAAFHALHAALRESVQPADAVEAIWVRGIADLTWELQRHTRLRAHRLALARWAVVCRVLGEGLYEGSETHKSRMKLAERWRAGDALAVPHVDDLLARRGYDPARLALEAHCDSLPDLEALDPLITRLEFRRSKLLREIDRRREFAVKMRAALARLAREDLPGPEGFSHARRAASPSSAPSGAARVEAQDDVSAGDLSHPSAGGLGNGSAVYQDDRLGRHPPPEPEEERLGRRPPAEPEEDRLGRRPPAEPEEDRLGRPLPPEPGEDRPVRHLPRAAAPAALRPPRKEAASSRTQSRPVALPEGV